MFDINGAEFVVLLVVAVLVIGPERLPKYAEQLARLTKQARRFMQDTRKRVDEELGEDVKDVDWAALDPRRYDPRRIVRDALLDDVMGPAPSAPVRPAARARPTTGATASAAAASSVPVASVPTTSTPYDDEAT
ncbi:Sec-independent protein translocase TatB [Cellulomonas hominis]